MTASRCPQPLGSGRTTRGGEAKRRGQRTLKVQICRPAGLAVALESVKLQQIPRNRIPLDGRHHVSVA